MRLRLIAAPIAKPVDVAQVRAQVEVFGSEHDAKLSDMIDATVSHLDGPAGVLGRALIEQEWELSLDAFPACELRLPLPPLQSITSMKYVDTTGVLQTLAPGDYGIDPGGDPGVIAPAYGASWPVARAQRNAVKVQFKAGYGAAATDVPSAIRSAILLMVGDLFENREGSITGTIHTVNPTVERLLFPFRILRP